LVSAVCIKRLFAAGNLYFAIEPASEAMRPVNLVVAVFSLIVASGAYNEGMRRV
jgi:hypothetical protein